MVQIAESPEELANVGILHTHPPHAGRFRLRQSDAFDRIVSKFSDCQISMKNLPELDGFWWVPSNSDQQLAGRLVSDGDTAKLVLTINSVLPSETIFPNQAYRDYELLHGKTTDGKFVSLLSCFDLNSTWTGSGVERRVIVVNYVLLGGLVPEEKLKNAFSGLSLKWPSLSRWFLRSGVKVERGTANFRAFNISYSPSPELAFPYRDDCQLKFIFGTDKLPAGGPLSEGVEFQEIVWVSLEPNQPSALEYYLERLNELVHFFSLCFLEYECPDKVTLVGDFDIERRDTGAEIRPQLELYSSSQSNRQSDRLPHPAEILVLYKSVESSLPSILKAWATVAPNLSPIRSLYFSAIYGPTKYIESIFLSLTQAAEVMHRRLHGGTYIDSATFDSYVKPHLLEAIPLDLSTEVITAYGNKLVFFNEISLAKRLKSLCERHEAAIQVFVPDWKKVVRKIVDARNYYTHYTNEAVSSKPDINDLVEGKELLRMLIELEMLATAGVEMSLLQDRARQCPTYIRRFPRARRN